MLSGAAVRTYCCGRRTRLVELLCAPAVVAVVRTRWSCCARLMLMWPSYTFGDAGAAVRAPCEQLTDYPTDRPGNQPGIQEKHIVGG